MRALAEEVLTLLRPAAQAKAISLELEGGNASVVGDTDKIKQVLINLVDNAVKFSPPRCAVRLKIANGGATLRVTVEDEGPGVAAADAPHLFERFFRGRSSDGTAGTGLGLAIARNLARLHGGDITLDTAIERGSRFTLTLPAMAGAR